MCILARSLTLWLFTEIVVWPKKEYITLIIGLFLVRIFVKPFDWGEKKIGLGMLIWLGFDLG